MQRLFGSIAAFFVGLFVSAPSIDVEQAKSDAAGLVAYAALAKAPTPTPQPEPMKITEQKETKVTQSEVPAAAEAQITASAPVVSPPALPSFSFVHAAVRVPVPIGRPTFAPTRPTTHYYATPPASRPTG